MIFLSQRLAKAKRHQAKSSELSAGTKPEPGRGIGRRGKRAILKGRKGQLGAKDGTKSAKQRADEIEDSTAAHCSCSNSLLCFRVEVNVFINERQGGIGKMYLHF